MFNIFGSVKKIVGLKKREPEVFVKVNKSKSWNQQLEKVSGFFDNLSDNVINEFNSIKEKSKDLSATNYSLGMRYLEEGNLKEAIFRFKITKKFWPENHEAYYQLIVCLILNHEFDEAEKIIAELMKKNPAYKEKIDQLIGDYEPQIEHQEQTNNNANVNS